jgi:hypothetical protein
MTLTVKKIARLHDPGRYGDGRGLYLQVNAGGSRAWVLRFELNGHERFMGLGPLADFTLEEARERARAARQLLKDGIDPIEHRKAERAKAAAVAAATVTFKEAAEQYYKRNSPKWTNLKHSQQFLSSLQTYAYPLLGRLPVDAIDTPLVLKVVEPSGTIRPRPPRECAAASKWSSTSPRCAVIAAAKIRRPGVAI